MSDTHIAFSALIFSGLAIIIGIVQFWRSFRSQYDSNAAEINHSFVLDDNFCKFILNVRNQEKFTDSESEFKYNVHLLGLLQFFQSNESKLKNKWGRIVYNRGNSLLIYAELDCSLGKIFWDKHKKIFDPDFCKIVDRIRKQKNMPAVIYPDKHNKQIYSTANALAD